MKPHKDECPVCKGVGYTRETATEFNYSPPSEFNKGQYLTVKPGSGCPRCGGTGRIDARPRSL